MDMRRRILIGLLAFGAIAGFGSGFAQLHRARARCAAYHEAHLAAALRSAPCTETAPAPAAPPPAP